MYCAFSQSTVSFYLDANYKSCEILNRKEPQFICKHNKILNLKKKMK